MEEVVLRSNQRSRGLLLAAKRLQVEISTLSHPQQSPLFQCRSALKSPQLTSQTSKTEFLNSILLFLAPDYGAGKYKFTALRANKFTNLSPLYFTTISPVQEDSSLQFPTYLQVSSSTLPLLQIQILKLLANLCHGDLHILNFPSLLHSPWISHINPSQPSHSIPSIPAPPARAYLGNQPSFQTHPCSSSLHYGSSSCSITITPCYCTLSPPPHTPTLHGLRSTFRNPECLHNILSLPLLSYLLATSVSLNVNNMSSAPTISTITSSYYDVAKYADPRFGEAQIRPPIWDPSPTTFIERQFHGAFLLPHQRGDDRIKPNSRVGIVIHFYAQGAYIGEFTATILYIQFVACHKHGEKDGDEWTIYSCSKEHASRNKSLYLIAMEAMISQFPVDILWVAFTNYRTSGAPAFIHPFPHRMGGDAAMLYSIQFPIGIDPYTMLHLGETLITNLITTLPTLVDKEDAAINTLRSNLFLFLTPNLSQLMGGSRLALLSAEDIPSSLIQAVNRIPFHLPDWIGSPNLEGSIPLKDTIIQVGGLLPSPTSLRDPDYQRSSLATYFLLPSEDLLETAKTALQSTLLQPPQWITHLTFNTHNGIVHLLVTPLPTNTPVSPARARILGLQVGLPSLLPSIQIQLRIDIAYYFHFPMETVGNHYHHMPLGPCTSPSATILSYTLGDPPLEALYLMNVFDCATAVSLKLPSLVLPTNIQNPDLPPSQNPTPPPPTPSKPEAPLLKGRVPREPKPTTPLQSTLLIPPKSSRMSLSSPTPDAVKPPRLPLSADTRIDHLQHQLRLSEQRHEESLRAYDTRISAIETEIARIKQFFYSQPTPSASTTPVSSSFGDIGTQVTLFYLNPTHYSPQRSLTNRLLTNTPLANANRDTKTPNSAKLPPRPISDLMTSWNMTTTQTLTFNSAAIPSSFNPLTHSSLIKTNPSTTLPHQFTVHHTNSRLLSLPSPHLSPNTQVQIIVLHISHKSYNFHQPFSGSDTINSILSLFQHKHFPLPSPFTITYNNNQLPLSTQLHTFLDAIINININFPIRGGAPPHCPNIQPQLPSNPLYKGPNLRKPLTLQQFNLRIATLNCNGYFKTSPNNRHQILWDFVSSNKIDVLFLIDHRSSSRTLEHIRTHGSSHLGTDIRLINSDTTLFMNSSTRGTALTNYHATVGGCAILTFGSLAHITFPSTFVDPSGANTFTGAKIIPHSSLPPIFLNALYLFPPSQGPTTLNSRILAYLRSQKTTLSPCKWQLSIIESLLSHQRDDHPNCIQIVGGDFNFSKWDSHSHPVSNTFLSSLAFTNSAYEAICLDPSIPTPVTFPATNSWIDHFLHTGRTEVTDFKHYPSTLLNCSTDHFPYSNDFTIFLPTQHHHIPRNLHNQAQSRLKSIHLRKNDLPAINHYHSLCDKHAHKFIPPTSTSSTESHELFYDHTCAFLVTLAKRATKYTIKPSMPRLTTWSPSLAFLYKYTHLLSTLANSATSPQTIHSKIIQFLSTHYDAQRVIDNITIFRYRHIISLIYPLFPSDLPNPFPTLPSAVTFITLTKKRCKNLCHRKHQLELRQHISASVTRNESLRREGRLKKVINWILEKESHPRFSTTVTTNNEIKSIPKAAHQATIQHFTSHFTQHPWIATSKINDLSAQGEVLRQSLLSGTWRTEFPTLTHSLLPHQQKYAAAYFDNFRYKASPQQQLDLQDILNKPISFDDFLSALKHRNGIKTPGPSGLSISILQATPIPILKSLHMVLQTMWSRRHVPKSWQTREMALLPKKPSSIHLNDMRPLMLLEVLRKLWLQLILRPVSTYITQQSLICQYQTGGIPNSGTEDAILQVINCLEDSTERAEPLEILAFDKAKAFDSPGRIGGISIAWQRIGVPADVAAFIANCDNENQIFPRTPYYLCSTTKHPRLSFHAHMGTPQGCSSASLSYLVVEDIILTTFQSQLLEIDPYLARDPHGLLFPQPPTQFVDDTYVFSNSVTGAQNAIQLLQTAEPILNIRINPTKTRHFSLHWTTPQRNAQPFYTLAPPTQSLHAFSPDSTPIPIPPIPLSMPTRVLGAFICPDLSDSYIPTLRNQISRTASMMLRKKATLDTIWTVVRQSVYPKFTYPLKFTSLSVADLDKLAAPLRHVIREKANASHIPNAALFSGASTPYSLPFLDLTTFILKEKESTMLRMLGGSHRSRQIIHCLLARGHRLISDTDSLSPIASPCPILPSLSLPASPSHHCWALSLIQYLQATNSNINIKYPTPSTPSQLKVTQTPLHSLLQSTLDYPLTVPDIAEFESSYHIYFLEELFPHTNDPPHSFLPPLLSLFPAKFHNFLSRLINTFHNNPEFSLGTIILRDHIIFKSSNQSIEYIEGITPSLDRSHLLQLLTRTWHLKRASSRTPTYTITSPNPPSPPTNTPAPISEFITSRYLHSSIGYTVEHIHCTTFPLQQIILPRKYSPFSEQYSPQDFTCSFPQPINTAWQSCTHQHNSPTIYTDGSFTPSSLPLTSLPPSIGGILTSAFIFSPSSTTYPWSARHVYGIQVTFPNDTTANNYTAEMLAIALACSLPGSLNTTIQTDAKGIVTSLNKTTNDTFSTSPLLPHLPRNYTETGILFRHIVNNHHRISLKHIRAHQEDHPNSPKTEHGTGNRIADLVAQNKISEARDLVHDLTIHRIPISEILLKTNHPSILTVTHNGTPFPLSTHHPNTTLKHYLTRRINHWLDNIRPTTSRMSTLDWSSLTWNLAGSMISMSRKSPYNKTFLFKVLYDALPNEFTKYKYSLKLPHDYDPHNDPDFPACPLCSSCNDSLTHLFCNCPDPTISAMRTKLISNLHSLPTNVKPTHPSYPSLSPILSLIMHNFDNPSADHRNLLGLFQLSTISSLQQPFNTIRAALKQVSFYSIPYIQTVWKVYCTQLHNPSTPSQHSTPTHQRSQRVTSHAPRVIVLSGNNATMSLQTVNDHIPNLYSRKTRRKQNPQPSNSTSTPSPSPHSSITRYFPLTQPVQHSQLPNNTSPLTNPTASQSPIPRSLSPPSSPNTNCHVSSKCSPNSFLFPKHTVKPSTHQLPSTPLSTFQTPHLPFTALEVHDIPSPHNAITFTHSLQSITPLPHINTASKSSVLTALRLHAHDVPPNGDCFFLTIQLYLLNTCSHPQPASSRELRTSVYNLLTQSKSGKQILRDHNQSPTSAAINILPNLRPEQYPNRDVYASDLAISAMATILQTKISVYSFNPNDTLLLYEYKPYPLQRTAPRITTSRITPITLWASHSHFQLLLPHVIPLPSLTANLLPLPHSPSVNRTPSSLPITIHPLHTPNPHACPHSFSHTGPFTSFCPASCHPYCPNHYTAFKPISLQRSPTQFPCSQIIALETTPPFTPILEISATIHHSPIPQCTTYLTPTHHSDALTTHPLVTLMHCTSPPNCELKPLLIPEPTPHLKLFLVTLTTILPYESIRIRPPPEPPPSLHQQPPRERNARKAFPTLITSYFKRSAPSPPPP